MLALPQDIIVYLSQFLNVEWIDDDDSEEDDTLVDDHGVGDYYPLRNLYATCKAFKWLEKYECVCAENGEFYWNITTKNINGKYNGMHYNLCPVGILGFIACKDGKIIRKNTFDASPAGIFRYINGKELDDECNRAWDDRKCPENCSTCKYFDYVQRIVYEKDSLIKQIHNDDNGTVVLREKRKLIEFEDQEIN